MFSCNDNTCSLYSFLTVLLTLTIRCLVSRVSTALVVAFTIYYSTGGVVFTMATRLGTIHAILSWFTTYKQRLQNEVSLASIVKIV